MSLKDWASCGEEWVAESASEEFDNDSYEWRSRWRRRGWECQLECIERG
jgi:hypothetical protein